MPSLLQGLLAAFLAACAVEPCGAVHPCAPVRCSVASQVAGAPDPETALDAFLLARKWLDLDELPSPSTQSAQIELAGVSGVCVILRQNGRLVGIGEDAGAGQLMLRRAVGRAVSKALADETVRSVRAVAGDRVTGRLSLELELAGALSPLIGRTVSDAADRIVPGDEGIALHRAEAVHLAFPSRLLATDGASRPEATIASLMIDAGLPAKDLPDFATEDRVSLSRFATIRLRQPSAGEPPAIVTRAGRTIDRAEVNASFVDALAIRLASRLAAQVVPVAPDDPGKGVGLLGTYNPTADRYAPPFAEPRDAALAALALAEAAASDRLPAPIRTVARDASVRLAEALLALPEAARATPTEELSVIALRRVDAGDAAMLESARDRLAARIASLESSHSVAAIALTVAALRALDAPEPAARLSSSLAAELAARPAAALDAALPIALALQGPQSRPGLPPGTATALREALAAGARALRSAQIDDTPADLVGGICMPGTVRTRADTASLRFSAGFALALIPNSPSDEAAELHRGALRFLAQHTAEDPWVGGFRRPEALRGLVRRSMSGDDCPPDALALGLIVALAGFPAP